MSIGIGPAGFGLGVAARSVKRDIAVVAGGLTAIGVMGGAGAYALRSTFAGGQQASEPRDGAKLIGEPVPKANQKASQAARPEVISEDPSASTAIEEIHEPPPRGASAEAIRNAAIEAAASQVGEWETSPNSSPTIDQYWKSAGGDHLMDPVHRRWSAAFASWAFNEAGAPMVDGDGSVTIKHLVDWAEEHGAFTAADAIDKPVPAIVGAHQPGPIRGSVVVFGSARDGAPRHVGIVEDYDPVSRRLTVISGNARDAVRREEISLDDPSIEGFIDAAAPHASTRPVNLPMPAPAPGDDAMAHPTAEPS